jgi:uncharacterized repeat protein (TIGR01451 family)
MRELLKVRRHRHGRAGRRRRHVGLVIAGLIAAALVPVGAQSAQALGTASCNTLYAVDQVTTANSVTNRIYTVNPSSGALTPLVSVGTQQSLNALALVPPTSSSTYAGWFIATEQWQSGHLSGTPTGGLTTYAINPATGQRVALATWTPYSAEYAADDYHVQALGGAWNPVTNTYWVVVAVDDLLYNEGHYDLYEINPATGSVDYRFSTPQYYYGSGGILNSDLVFDQQGNLYLLASRQGTANEVYRYDAPLPNYSTPAWYGGGEVVGTVPANLSVAGIAFAADGTLQIEASNRLYGMDPTTGAIRYQSTMTGTDANGNPTNVTDFASCSGPNSLEVIKNITSRVSSTDQFEMYLDSATKNVTTNDTGVTTGTDTGLQSDNAETAGPVLVVDGDTFTIGERASGTTDLSKYSTTWKCIETVTGQTVASGTGTSGQVTIKDIGYQASTTVCTFTNTPKPTSDLALTKTATPAATGQGGPIEWTIKVTNNGPQVAADWTVTDSIPAGVTDVRTSTPGCTVAGSTVTCTGTNLGVGQSYEIKVSGVAPMSDGTLTNTATVTTTGLDSNPDNNTDTAQVIVTHEVGVPIANAGVLAGTVGGLGLLMFLRRRRTARRG